MMFMERCTSGLEEQKDGDDIARENEKKTMWRSHDQGRGCSQYCFVTVDPCCRMATMGNHDAQWNYR